MNFDENNEDVYFTSPEDIKGKIKYHAHDNTNEEHIVEYDINASSSSSRSHSMTDEYVLPDVKQNYYPSAPYADTDRPRLKKKVYQDEYDEDHYTLARPVEDWDGDPYIKKANVNEEEKKDSVSSGGIYKCCRLTKRKVIIFVIIAVLLVGVVAGVAVYILSSEKGKEKYQIVNFSNY